MSGTIVTVGTFDGFHRGHRHLIATLVDEGRRRGLEPLVVSFSQHPLSVLRPDAAPPLLGDREQLRRDLRDAGVDRLVLLDFTRETAALTARQFMAMLRRDYDARALLMGYNNSLGSDRLPSHADYIATGRSEGIDVIFDEPFTDPATDIAPNSTMLRTTVAEGRMDDYRRYAGSAFSITGAIARGKRNGHLLGFPTLNLAFEADHALPLRGVYRGRVAIAGATDATAMPAVINVGANPSIAADNPVTIEAHVIDAELGELYGSRAIFFFDSRLRDEHRFASLDELRAAIAADIATCRQALSSDR